MRRGRSTVGPGALAMTLVVGLAACGGGRTHDDAASSSRSEIDQKVCAILEVPLDHTTGGLDFSELLQRPASDVALQGTAGAILLLRSRYDGDLGPYEPAIDHFADIARADAGERKEVPRPTAEVRDSARKLDRALADGLCK